MRATDWRAAACLAMVEEKNALASGLLISHLTYRAANKKTAPDNEAAHKYKKGNQSVLPLIVAIILPKRIIADFR